MKEVLDDHGRVAKIVRSVRRNAKALSKHSMLRVLESIHRGDSRNARAKGRAHVLKRRQVAALLSMGALEGFDQGEYDRTVHTLNFTKLYAAMRDEGPRGEAARHKFAALCCYFEAVGGSRGRARASGTVEYRRVYREPDFVMGLLEDEEEGRGSESFQSVCANCVVDEEALLEDVTEHCGKRVATADFANKAIGGGVLGSGAVQEEILFTVHPELIAARYFMSEMTDNEAIVMTGAERIAKYTLEGPRKQFRFMGPVRADPYRDDRVVVAFDALHFSSSSDQFARECLERELVKAVVAFSAIPSSHEYLATGRWGAGAFGGHVQLKILIQLLAASLAQINLYICTFGISDL